VRTREEPSWAFGAENNRRCVAQVAVVVAGAHGDERVGLHVKSTADQLKGVRYKPAGCTTDRACGKSCEKAHVPKRVSRGALGYARQSVSQSILTRDHTAADWNLACRIPAGAHAIVSRRLVPHTQT
jgi:hypothetical protein